MSEKIKKFSDQLDELIKSGDMLHLAIQHDCHPKEFEAQVREVFKNDDDKVNEYLDRLPSFRRDYQKWYSEAHAVIKQTLPDRLSDFVSYYEYPRVRKDIAFQNYMIKDYLQGLRISRGGGYEVVADGSAAIPEFVQQLNMVKAAKETLESSLLNLRGILQADLFDTEIATAAALAKAGYLRAAGAICGVVLEEHLKQVCDTHGISLRKKNPGISDLNQALKDQDILTVPKWRFIQHLADIRNLCDHAKGKESTKEDIEDLVSGTEKTLKTVF